MLSTKEKERYARQILLSEIGEDGQQRLKAASVLVVGAGGLGCPVLQYLLGAGVGSIGIVDDDVVSFSNLHRQTLYTAEDVGMTKVNVAVGRLKAQNSNCKLFVHKTFLTEANAESFFMDYDIIVDCTDNFRTRYLIDKTALEMGKVWVYGSILEYEGQVAVFEGFKGQSYRKLFSEENYQQDNASKYGVLGVLPGIIGCLQANEVLKLICGFGETLSGKLLVFNTKTCQQQLFKI